MDPHMKEAIKRKLQGLKEGGHEDGHGSPTLDMLTHDANPHSPSLGDHDGDEDDADYDKLNPGDRAPDLKSKGKDVELADNSGPVHDSKGHLADADRMNNLEAIAGPPHMGSGVAGRSAMNIHERAKMKMQEDIKKFKSNG